MKKPNELTYEELYTMLGKKIAEKPSMKNEKAIIMLGSDYYNKSSYVKGLHTMENGEVAIQGTYVNGKEVD